MYKKSMATIIGGAVLRFDRFLALTEGERERLLFLLSVDLDLLRLCVLSLLVLEGTVEGLRNCHHLKHILYRVFSSNISISSICRMANLC